MMDVIVNPFYHHRNSLSVIVQLLIKRRRKILQKRITMKIINNMKELNNTLGDLPVIVSIS